MDITQENMASLFRFFMTYNELCKSFANIDLENMYYLDLRVDCESRYIGNIYTQFSDIPDFENCMHIDIAVALLNQKIIVDWDEHIPANVLVSEIEQKLRNDGMFVVLRQDRKKFDEQDNLREFEISLYAHQNIESKKMYKKLRAFFERQCVFNNGYFFGKETYSQRMKWTFDPYLTGENAFVLNEEEEYTVWYRDPYVRKIMEQSYEGKLNYLKSICFSSKEIEYTRTEQSAILNVLNSFYMDESVELKDILSLFNDECFLFSGWSLMDKCFDVLISIMEKKGAEGYIQLIEGLDNIPKQGYKCGLCKIISYCLRKNNKSKFLNIIPYLSISSKETLINKFQIINSKKLQKEIDSVMDILLTDNVSK